MSSWTRASSSPKRNSASAFANSVLPTPVGPAKMNEPPGRFGSFKPLRVRRIDCASALTASSWPITRLCSSSSMRSSFEVSVCVRRTTGMPVDMASTSAISWSVTSAISSDSPPFQAASFALRSSPSLDSWSRRAAAFSKSWSSIADSLLRRSSLILSSNSRSSGGAVIRRMRKRAPASSTRSIALSGRKRSET